MLSLQNVSKRFSSGKFGVKDFSLDISSGELGLLGPNGAGKTTLMQMLATVTHPTSGQILFQGEDVLKHPNRLRQKLGYLPQDFGVYNNLTALEFLDYFAALKGVRRTGRVLEMLEMVNLHTVARRTIGGFSGGMKQRLGIAQALINNPDLIIVDEPTAGLDPEERVRFRNILSELGAGKLVILSTHIVSDIESIATQIAVMREGRLIAAASPENLLKAAMNSVWEVTLSSEQFEQARAELKVSTAIRKTDGVHVRVVAPAKPFETAVAAEPNLEDAFLFYMNFQPLTLERDERATNKE